jgi:hypothetical protein
MANAPGPDRDLFDYDGVYMNPSWVFTDGVVLDQPEPKLSEDIEQFARNNGTRIASELEMGGRLVLVTHGSGMFVRASGVIGRDGYDQAARNSDRLDAVRVCNLILCELVLDGTTAWPVTFDDFCGAMRSEDTASLWVAGGLKQVRSWATEAILDGKYPLTTMHWPVADVAALRAAHPATRALKLAKINPALPDFVASAVASRYSERPAEALLFGWIVAEQLINTAWNDHVNAVSRNNTDRQRLTDGRSYTSAIQIDTLHALGRISTSTLDSLHRARKQRNALAHSAKLDHHAAVAAITAMGDAMIELAGIQVDPKHDEWRYTGGAWPESGPEA